MPSSLVQVKSLSLTSQDTQTYRLLSSIGAGNQRRLSRYSESTWIPPINLLEISELLALNKFPQVCQKPWTNASFGLYSFQSPLRNTKISLGKLPEWRKDRAVPLAQLSEHKTLLAFRAAEDHGEELPERGNLMFVADLTANGRGLWVRASGLLALLGLSCTNESAEGEIGGPLHSPFPTLIPKDEWRVTTGETISRSL